MAVFVDAYALNTALGEEALKLGHLRMSRLAYTRELQLLREKRGFVQHAVRATDGKRGRTLGPCDGCGRAKAGRNEHQRSNE